MFAESVAAPPGFDADELHGGIRHEGVEDADGVAAAADAGEHGVRQAAFGFEDLAAGLLADHFLEIPHHQRVRMRAEGGAEQVIRVGDVGDPVPHGLADGVLERAAAAGDAHHCSAQQAHAEDVQALPPHVLFAHIDGAVETEQRAHGGGGHAVLSGSGLRDDAPLAHAPGEQGLPEAVIDFVGAGVEQVFALEVDARPAQRFAQPAGAIERSRTPRVVAQQVVELALESGVLPRREVRGFQFFERGHQDFRHVPPAVRSEVPALVRLRGQHWNAFRAAWMNSVIFRWSLIPGALSMREHASTPQGLACATALTTLDASRPPARMIFLPLERAMRQSKGTPAPP